MAKVYVGSLKQRVAVAAFVVVFAGAAGCQGGDRSSDSGVVGAGPSGGSASPSAGVASSVFPTPSSSELPAPPEALAAYDAMWEDLIAVAETSDYKNPRIAAHMRYQPLTAWTQEMANRSGQGVVARGRITWKPHVTSVTPPTNPDRVEVADCVDTTGWLKYKRDGSLVDDKPGGHRRSASAITRSSGGKWYVTEQITGEIGTC